MQTELVRQLTIEDLSQNAVLDYIDGDIAFANRLRLPHVPHAKPVKIDALKLLICSSDAAIKKSISEREPLTC